MRNVNKKPHEIRSSHHTLKSVNPEDNSPGCRNPSLQSSKEGSLVAVSGPRRYLPWTRRYRVLHQVQPFDRARPSSTGKYLFWHQARVRVTQGDKTGVARSIIITWRTDRLYVIPRVSCHMPELKKIQMNSWSDPQCHW